MCAVATCSCVNLFDLACRPPTRLIQLLSARLFFPLCSLFSFVIGQCFLSMMCTMEYGVFLFCKSNLMNLDRCGCWMPGWLTLRSD